MAVRVQEADFDIGAEVAALAAAGSGGEAGTDPGAVVTFTGLVRGDGGLTALELEHYPGMTEAALAGIEAEARARWPLSGVTIIHRTGRLLPGERIVLVATASAHRQAAFAAADFLMDYLKSRAPFWKKEVTPDGARWVDARETDRAALERWQDR
jgi:molybdopterin synthase catalytic subunit